MSQIMFSIIIVSLNPGEKLLETVKSVEKQTCKDYEVIIKDGGSKDASLTMLQQYVKMSQVLSERVRLYETPDKSIYDGMNQAVTYAGGAYLYFLNCGDTFHDGGVLARIKEAVTQTDNTKGNDKIFYGDIYDMLQNTVVSSNPRIDAFACYRNVPCHQACFYGANLFRERGYKTWYRVRGDYEHFLWCFLEKKAQPVYTATVIADYEGGGYSETAENVKRSKQEHKEITALYMSRGQRVYYRFLLLITLSPVRTWMAHNPLFSKFYNKIKELIYRKK